LLISCLTSFAELYRLGVGAPVPESAGLAGKNARLKGRLVDKRRAREEELDKMPSSDEEESRTGAIQKRAKMDPFERPQASSSSQKLNFPFPFPFPQGESPGESPGEIREKKKKRKKKKKKKSDVEVTK